MRNVSQFYEATLGTRTICCSTRIDIIQLYLIQWGYVGTDIEVNPVDSLDYSKELIPFNSHIYLTRLEMTYYRHTFERMYDDMKTTVTGLIMYDKLGGFVSSGVEDIDAQRKFIKNIYHSLETYDKYLDSLDFIQLKKHILLDPMSSENMMIESIKLDREYRRILDQ